MPTKSLDAKDINVTNNTTVVSPFDCSYGLADNNDSDDSGGLDWGLDDEDSGTGCR